MKRILLVWALATAACIVEAPGAPKGAAGRPSTAGPAQVRVGANLEDKIEIVGASLSSGSLVPGEQLHVTAFYRVLGPVEQDYGVFVHVEDLDGRMERMNVDHQPGGGRPTNQWAVGETVRDDYDVYVPPNTPIRGINIYTGFWRQDSRLKLKNPEQVRNDGNSRVLLATVPVAQ